MTAMLIAASVFVSHVSAARLDLRNVDIAKPTRVEADDTRRWLADRLASDPADTMAEELDEHAALPRLRAAAIDLIAATRAYERACLRV